MSGDCLKICGRGKPIDNKIRCIECELVWYRACHEDAVRRVASTARKIFELEYEMANNHALTRPRGK